MFKRIMKFNIKLGIQLIIMTGLLVNNAFSTPEISIPSDTVISSGTQIEIPIYIDEITGIDMVGYALRIDYSTTFLSNPSIITENTLSDGKNVQSGPPVDGLGGQYVITLFSGFSTANDGILVKLNLDVNQNFSESPVSFITAKTELFDSGYNSINKNLENGFMMRLESDFDEDVFSIGKRDSFEDASSESGSLQLSTTSFNGNGFIFAGHNNGQLSFGVTNQDDDYDKILSRAWQINVSENKPDIIIINVTIPDLPDNAKYFGLIKNTDNAPDSNQYTDVVLSSSEDYDNNKVTFEVPSIMLSENAYYSVAVKYQDNTMARKYSIPTFTEWGLILFISILLLVSINKIKKQKYNLMKA